MKSITPLEFITALRETDELYIEALYTEGDCYKFYKLLKFLFPSAEIFINDKANHVATKIDGILYDIRGIVNPDKYFSITKSQLRKAKKWSFQKNNLLKLDECPACEEPFVYQN